MQAIRPAEQILENVPMATTTRMLCCPIGPAWRALAFATALCSSGSDAATPPPVAVAYPAAGSIDERSGNYYVELLKLALAKAEGSFVVVPSNDPSTGTRALFRLARHDGVDVFWGPTTNRLEQDFRAVPVPLDKGILGWRLLLINRDDTKRFASLDALAQLRTLLAGQATEWSDTQVLRENGLPVVTAPLYKNLMPMLAARRFDYFPRGVGEIAKEAHQHPEFVIEPHLALHYPVCTYFFVAKDNVALAKVIENGLLRARADGSFAKLFEHFNGAALHLADLDQRRVLELRNTAQPPSCSQ